jgi:hypothetical protein
MNPIKRTLPVLILLLLAFSRISAQDNPSFRHIPPEATAVYQINLPVITSKMSWQEIISSVPIKQKPNKHDILDALKDPAGAGIDIGKDIFLSEAPDPAAAKAKDLTWIVHLTDSAKFSAFLRRQRPGLHILTHPGKVRSAAKGGLGAAWNKDLGIIVFAPSADHSAAKPDSMTIRAGQKSLLALAGFQQSFYLTDPNFRTVFSDDGDIHICAGQGNGLALLTAGINPLSPSRGKEGIHEALLKSKNKTLSTIRFKAGSLTMESRTLMPAGSNAGIYAAITKPLNTDLLARIPKGNLLGFFSFSINPTGIADLLTKYDVRNKIDSQLLKINLSLDTVLRAFKGDVLLAAMEPEQADANQKPKVPLYFATTIGDLPSFTSIAARVKQMEDSLKPDSTGNKRGLLGKTKTFSRVKDNVLVISTTQESVDAYINNTEKRNTDFIPADMKNNPVMLLIDFKTLADFAHHMANQPAGKDKKIVDILDALDTLIFTSSSVKDGSSGTFFELKMTDQKNNSLKTLAGLLH